MHVVIVIGLFLLRYSETAKNESEHHQLACTNETLRLHNEPEVQLLDFSASYLEQSNLDGCCLRFTLDDGLLGNGTVKEWQSLLATISGVVKLTTLSVGRTHLNISIVRCDSGREMGTLCRQRVVISSPHRFIDRVFNIIVFVLVIFVSLLMGALLDTSLIIKQIRKPLPLIVGFCAQYLIMPITAFLITWIFKYPSVQGIGLFIVGCSPGGTSSNQWTVLFDGDIDLSAVMTFLSTVGSLALMPAWLFSLGRHYVGQLEIYVPYWLLARNLFMVIGPYAVGICFANYFPRLKGFVVRLVKPLVVILLIFFSGVGTYVNLHLFKMLRWKHMLTAPLLPWLGFTFGFIISTLCRLPNKQARTVSIETGFQNAGIAMLIIQNNFPPPESEMAGVIVLVTSILSSLPMLLAYLGLRIMQRIRKDKKEVMRISETTEMHRLIEPKN